VDGHQDLPSDVREVDAMVNTVSNLIRWSSRSEICSERRFFALARTLFHALKTRRSTIRVLSLRRANAGEDGLREPREFVVRFGRGVRAVREN
jgi:uncharacterized DUF497 family protein